MTISTTPTSSDVYTVLRDFILAVVPTSGFEAIRGQVNRVPSPSSTDYAVYTSSSFERLATNLDEYADVRFTASIAGNTMTVTASDYGTIKVGSYIYGTGVADNTTVTALGSGTGGTGTYTVSQSQTVAEEVMAAGVENVTQNINLCIQVDFHGDSSAENSAIFCTLFRDEYGVDYFEGKTSLAVPLHADDPKQIPFMAAEDQWETRWVVYAYMQVDKSVIDIPTQFSDSATVGLIEVDATYPA